MRSGILITLLSLTLFSCSKNDQTASGSTTFNTAKVDSLIERLYENDKFMGSASVSENGSVIYSKAIGYDDIETKKLSTPSSKYRIASISKMFTATLVFKAIEENKLTLGQTIQEYFPDVENAEKITIKIYSTTEAASIATQRMHLF